MKQHMMMMIVIKVNIDFNRLAFGILDELACVHVECHQESERKKKMLKSFSINYHNQKSIIVNVLSIGLLRH